MPGRTSARFVCEYVIRDNDNNPGSLPKANVCNIIGKINHPRYANYANLFRSQSITMILRDPLPTRPLSRREQIIVLESSKLHGSRFPPWQETPGINEFKLGADQTMFTYVDNSVLPDYRSGMNPAHHNRDDDAHFRLSRTQLAVFHGWKRPEEILGSSTPTMNVTQKVDLVQDVTSDCSVVASLCASSARREKGHPAVGFAAL